MAAFAARMFDTIADAPYGERAEETVMNEASQLGFKL
jgi:hypothetical protein